MEFIAIALFGIGIILVIIGYFSNSPRSSQIHPSFSSPPVSNPQAQNSNSQAQNEKSTQFNDVSMPQVQVKPTVVPEPLIEAQINRQVSVPVKVQQKNPSLFKKTSYLYLDQGNNNYSGDDGHFDLKNFSNIRRFGQGIFNYDGFCFYFDHENGQERFALDRIHHISFYPNCIVLIQKKNLPAALFFVDESESIRKVLETFRVENV